MNFADQAVLGKSAYPTKNMNITVLRGDQLDRTTLFLYFNFTAFSPLSPNVFNGFVNAINLLQIC
jgi:hypothetical protein